MHNNNLLVLDDIKKIETIDRAQMLILLRNFPDQLTDAQGIVETANINQLYRDIKNIVFIINFCDSWIFTTVFFPFILWFNKLATVRKINSIL